MDPSSEQRWTTYAVAVVGFSLVGIVLLFALIALQEVLPLARGASMHLDTALNTAVSFVTNTNWQSYAGESGTSPLVQTLGLTVQNFVSPAVGLAVAVALVRGIARSSGTEIGNFWVDLVRGTVRILLPLALVGAVVLLLGGVIQNLTEPTTVTTVSGGSQVIQGGLVASQEAIKELGTNGGGYFNANSAHPFENPTAGRTSSRSSSSSSSRSRSRGPTASSSATAARAGPCSASWLPSGASWSRPSRGPR